jgi:hypothetical protein
MTIMVDEVRLWPTTIRCFREGSAHLTTDGPVEELHAFAALLGLKRAWFQDRPTTPRYDLTPIRRAKAIQMGAVPVSAREQISRRPNRIATEH